MGLMNRADEPKRAALGLRSFWSDFTASIVVFLVARPLCMGIVIASGFPHDKAAAVGINSGIVGGLVLGSLSGCPLQVTGPAAGLAVIVGQLISEHGVATLGLIVMVERAIQ
jgi:MFS superfamily sulfate permease-like transporter